MYSLRHLLLIHAIINLLHSAHVNEARNLLCLGSRKQEVAAQAWQRLDEAAHLVLEAHLQTFVKLVDDEILDMIRRKVALAEMVVQSTWSSEDNLRTNLLQHPMLIHRSTTAVASHGTEPRTHILQYGRRLQSQLTAGSNHDCLRLIIARIHQLGKRQEISQRLSTARRRKNNYILIAMCNRLKSLLLHLVQRDSQFIQYSIYHIYFLYYQFSNPYFLPWFSSLSISSNSLPMFRFR